MYNTLFGVNNLARVCLAVIGGVDVTDFPRFRDAILIKDEEHGYAIEILTRTGGANRGQFGDEELKSKPGYIKDWDDEYDSTYAHYLFSLDEDVRDNFNYEKAMADQSRKNLNLREMFENHFKEMGQPGTDANKKAEQMARGLKRLIEENSGDEIKVISPDQILKAGEDTEDK